MTTRKPPHEHADIFRPFDRRFHFGPSKRLSVWLIYDGDTTPCAEVHLNERGSRTRSPRLIEACRLLVLAGETFDFVEAVACLGEFPLRTEDVLPALVARARDILEKKESITP